ncbi:unnamed protein product [Ectocarpus sp. CCAP 1310/34]|nr:unnamed protein product [Ectocarpus sp. CCAP 1310/34]
MRAPATSSQVLLQQINKNLRGNPATRSKPLLRKDGTPEKQDKDANRITPTT